MPTFRNKPLLLEATVSAPLSTFLPRLRTDLVSAGVWVSRSDRIASRCVQFHLELHAHATPALYISLIRSGLQLSRPAHLALAGLCSRQIPVPGRILPVRLQIRSFAAASLHRLRPILTICA